MIKTAHKWCALFLFVCISPLSFAKNTVIYDTDMAIDDWFALLYLAKHPDVELAAITISNSGETLCQEGLDNARNLLKLANHPDIPVACGDAYPLDGYFVFPMPWQEDANTLSGIDLGQWLEQPIKGSASNGHAADLLHKVISTSEKPVTIVAVGPMTNIAQWLLYYQQDKPKVDQLVMMGGTYATKGNIIVPHFTDNNPNKVSEWNYFIDPVATKITLEAEGIDKTMVGLDVTNTVQVTHAFADDFKQHVSNEASQFADQVFDKNRWFIDSGEYYVWDVMAAIVAVRPELCKGDEIAVTALAEAVEGTPYTESSDLNMPATNAFKAPRQHLKTATAGQVVDATQTSALTKVCKKTKGKKVFKEFISTLTH